MSDALDPGGAKPGNPKIGSDRNFGLVFGLVFALIALWPLFRGNRIHLWLLAVAGIFLIAAIVVPRSLGPLNRLWFRLGILLSKIVTPLVMGILFFVAVTPIAYLMRWFSTDPLRLKRDPAAKSYFIERSPPGPVVGSFKDQF
jgi:predicted membrane metal-binding protein